jgi:hypothetical protein
MGAGETYSMSMADSGQVTGVHLMGEGETVSMSMADHGQGAATDLFCSTLVE